MGERAESAAGEAEGYRFGVFELYPARRELRRDGRTVELQPKVFDLIAFLLRQRDRVVDKNELLEAVWPRQVVTEAALSRCVMKARRALGDDAERPQVILTLHGRGFRFVAAVQPLAEPPVRQVDPAPDASLPISDAVDPVTEALTPHAAPPDNPRPPPWRAMVLLLTGLVLLGGWFWIERAGRDPSGPVRVAVLPALNATGEVRYDWAGLGLMSAIADLLRAGGRIEVLATREVLDLEQGLAELAPEQRLARLRAVYGLSHTVEGRLEKRAGRMWFTHTLTGPDGTRRERTASGDDVVALARAAGAELSVLLGATPGVDDAIADSFASEAFLRGRALQLQGDNAAAGEYFRLAIEQAPEAFWPRYEHALTQRDLGDVAAARGVLEALLTEADAQHGLRERLAVRNALGIMSWRAGDNDDAARQLEEARVLAERLGDRHRAASVLVNLGILATYRRDHAAAREYLRQAQQAEAASGMEKPSGNVFNSLAQLDLREGDLDSAGRHLEAALTQFRLVGNRRNEAIVLNGLAALRSRQGRFEEARDLAVHTLGIHHALGNRSSESSALTALAIAEAQLGRLHAAIGHAEAALAIAEEIDERPRVAIARSLLGQFQTDLGRFDAARSLLQQAQLDHLAVGDSGAALRDRLHLARLALAEDEPARAEREAQALWQGLPASGSGSLRVDTALLLARLRLQDLDAEGAGPWLQRAAEILDGMGDRRRHARLGLLRAEQAALAGDTAAAERELAAAEAELGDDPDLLRGKAAVLAARGEHAAALTAEQAARQRAGERWTARDQARLEDRQAAAR